MIRAMLALALTVASAPWAATPASAQSPEEAPRVGNVEFPGARSFSEAQLAAAIVTGDRCPGMAVLLCWTGVGLNDQVFDPVALEADALRIRLFYYERGFRNAAVEVRTDTREDRVDVDFRITEGEPVRVNTLQVTGAPSVAGDALPLRPGAPFDMIAYEAGRDTLLNRLRDSGYPRPQVLLAYTIPQEDPLSAEVLYEVYPGTRARVGSIRVVGAEETTPALARRMLTFEEGQVYNRSALLESQRNLYSLQVFRHAEIQADLDALPDTLIPVTIRLVEGPMRRVRLGGGVNTLECANVEGRWTSRNFLGGGRRLDVRGRLGNLALEQCRRYLDPVWSLENADEDLTGLVSADFTQPWLFGPRNNVGVGLFAERRSVPEVFVRSAVGGYLSVSRSLGRGAALSLAYRLELTELSTGGDLFFCVSFIACAYEDIQVLKEPHWLSPVALSLAVDRTDAVFTPSTGYTVRGDLEHAGAYTGSDFAYTRFLAEGTTYNGKPGGLVLALRFRGGIGWPHAAAGTGILRLNPQKRFFAGGPNSVRGFGQYRLGPTVLGIDAVRWLAPHDEPDDDVVGGAGCAVAAINDGTCDARVFTARPGVFEVRPAGGEVLLEGNLELRFPLPVGGGKLRGAAFLDAGQVWTTSADVDMGDVVATPGIGVRYMSPVGPIRVDAGFNLQGGRSLPVLTTRVEECMATTEDCVRVPTARIALRSTDDIVVLADRVEYDPHPGALDTFSGFFQRFQLHFSIGQAF
ncbi:MAG TPA: BamA/TamA family outer membrane protein [Longimicrobiales bacterium]|nr:BamA/TamA family outer membrane protein [Longimicrobiales bacterium]